MCRHHHNSIIPFRVSGSGTSTGGPADLVPGDGGWNLARLSPTSFTPAHTTLHPNRSVDAAPPTSDTLPQK